MNAGTIPHATIESLRGWLALSPDATLAVDAAGIVVLANGQAEHMFGYADGALCGKELEVLVPSHLREAHRAHRQEFMRTPQSRVVISERELSGQRQSGERFPIGVSLAPVATEQGTVVVVSVRDISQTWRARRVQEHARRDTIVMQIGRLAVESPDYEKAIQRIPELVADALEVGAVAVFSTDWRHKYPYIRASTGLSESAAKSLTAAFGDTRFIRNTFVAGGPDAMTMADPHHAHLAPVYASIEAAGFRDAAIVPLVGRDESLGAIAALTTESAPFDHGKIDFLRSVANLLAAAGQRNRTEEHLAHVLRLEAIGQLTGGVAHDFNNLLTVISGNLQLLEAELPTDSAAQEIIESASRAVSRGASLTHRLLAFARRQPLQPRAVVPQPLLEELGRMLRRTLGEAIAIEIDCAAGVPDIYADPNELDTALVNLALNARDAMPRGGRLTIAAREVVVASTENDWKLPPARYVAFAISDTGTGIAPEIRAHVLEPFFTTKAVGKGSGLGLSMVYGFASQSGGAFTIDSRLGYGTRVELLLPVATATRSSEPVPVTRTTRHAPRGTILVVEDEADVRQVAVRFLRALGHSVLDAPDAKAALQLLTDHPDISLLFSDVVLGSGMNGIELAQAAQRLRPGLPVLLASGYEGGGLPHEPAQSSAPYELLRKPYQREQLTEAVQRILRSD